MTYMPNQFNHDNQEEAGLEVRQFWPLVRTKFSEDLQLFVCIMYMPICITNYHRPLRRSVCERAKAGCKPILGYIWPEILPCDDLPEIGNVLALNMSPYTQQLNSPQDKNGGSVLLSNADLYCRNLEV